MPHILYILMLCGVIRLFLGPALHVFLFNKCGSYTLKICIKAGTYGSIMAQVNAFPASLVATSSSPNPVFRAGRDQVDWRRMNESSTSYHGKHEDAASTRHLSASFRRSFSSGYFHLVRGRPQLSRLSSYCTIDIAPSLVTVLG